MPRSGPPTSFPHIGWALGLAALACRVETTEPSVPVDDPGPTTHESDGELQVTFYGSRVLDPKLSGEPSLRLGVTRPRGMDGCRLTVEAESASGQHAFLLSDHPFDEDVQVTWTGRDDAGRPHDPGPVDLHAEAICEGETRLLGRATAHVVRLGIVGVDFDGSPHDGQALLAYHRLDESTWGHTLLEGTVEWLNDRPLEEEPADLDDRLGLPRSSPAPWNASDRPPWGAEGPGRIGFGRQNVPFAQVAGTRPLLTITFGATAYSTHQEAAVPAAVDARRLPSIRVRSDGAEPADADDLWWPGRSVRFRADAVPAVLGRSDITLAWRFEHEDVDGAWIPIPGTVTSTHPVWILADLPHVPDSRFFGGPPPAAWVGTLAEVEPAVAGLAASDAFAVMDALRDALHYGDRMIYDGRADYFGYRGALAYWDYTWIELGPWIDRAWGLGLDCHSIACVLSNMANQIGLPAEVLTLSGALYTRFVRSAGTGEWAYFQFGSHAIVTIDGGAHVWDASVDLDGREDLTVGEPLPVAANGLPLERYLELYLFPIGFHSFVRQDRCHVH